MVFARRFTPQIQMLYFQSQLEIWWHSWLSTLIDHWSVILLPKIVLPQYRLVDCNSDPFANCSSSCSESVEGHQKTEQSRKTENRDFWFFPSICDYLRPLSVCTTQFLRWESRNKCIFGSFDMKFPRTLCLNRGITCRLYLTALWI